MHGYSLEEQRAACEARAREAGAACIAVYADEGVSGEILERPGLTALREDVRAGQVDLVLVRHVDRLSRKLAHQLILAEEFKKAGVTVEFLDSNYQDTPEGRLFYSLQGAIAEYEKEKIRDRTMRGKRQKASRGLVPDVFNTYGYRFEPQSGRIEIDNAQAEIVREIFHRFVAGDFGINGIARILNERGVPTRTGRCAWSRTVIRQMLRQHAYVGTWYYGKRDCRGVRVAVQRGEKWRPKPRDKGEWISITVPAIIDQATWDRAQERLNRARRLWVGQKRATYLLSGLIRCGDCGAPMGGRKQKFFGHQVRGYTCFRNIQGVKHIGCRPFKFINAERVEQAVWDTVSVWLENPEALVKAIVQNDSDTDSLRSALAQIENGLAQVARGRESLLTLLAEGRRELADTVRTKLDDLSRREERLLCRKREIETTLTSRTGSRHTVAELRCLALEIVRDLDSLDFGVKRTLVRQLIRSVVISGRPREGLRVTIHTPLPS